MTTKTATKTKLLEPIHLGEILREGRFNQISGETLK